MQIQIQPINLDLTPELAQHVTRRLHFSLARFNGRVRLALVRLETLGAIGDAPQRECRLEIRTAWDAHIVIQERAQDVFTAISLAADRAGRSVERQANIRYGFTQPRLTGTQFGD